ncbi:sulfotransferase family protein [Pacificibacter maritimus]|uniref:Sulfotransferase family protein n=1 Tax=Pacificibacter maritimus TaxID=762213 RepID=A0A3N4V1X4_9RHOB|nr:sulfotransferase [Pacificibacter maritimus]RPE71087.1 sulfotransferase family protein [Pacificibacter maritimus]
MTQPVFMFCVGATKAGTSWLYDYLHGHPDCKLQAVKESHFFDTIEKPHMKPQIDTWKNNRDTFKLRLAQATLAGDSAKIDRLSRQIEALNSLIKAVRKRDEGLDQYLAYVRSDSDNAKLVGDLTPSYALLGEARLDSMSKLDEDVRFVFLMRDPIDRLWSHVRMTAKRSTDSAAEFEAKARAVLKRTANGGETHITTRGDYPAIVQKLQRVIPKDRLHFEFFEELLTDAGVRKLCDFLGISYVPAETDRKVHEGKSLNMDDEMLGWAADVTAPHYAFVKETFGALPQRWQTNMARVN